MPNIGPLEIGIILLIVLIIFGPKKLPDLGRSLGSSIREFKGGIGGGDDDEKGHEQVEDPKPVEEKTTEKSA